MIDPPLDPGAVLDASPEDADRLLDRLERAVPLRNGVAELPASGFTEALVFGDTHGDWRSTLAVREEFLRPDGGPRCLVGLGDYVDRVPDDSADGSVVNACLLLDLAARFPDRVFLVQGNHETASRIPVLPSSLPEEVDELWGPVAARYTRLAALLERGPLAAVSANGLYFAHAGFPRTPLPTAWRRVFDDPDETTLVDIVWTECEASRLRRGVSEAWTAEDLTRFLRATGLSVFLRGHDPDLTGRSVYDGRCLTLHTTRVFERYGGVISARVPLGRPVRTTADLVVEHLPTEGRRFPDSR
ncbi:MAG TPA: metallophosphoesterase [Thermoplasmata archaeon]|nr:metallophosphoesterase [Thermoplasmata archaeon]